MPRTPLLLSPQQAAARRFSLQSPFCSLSLLIAMQRNVAALQVCRERPCCCHHSMQQLNSLSSLCNQLVLNCLNAGMRRTPLPLSPQQAAAQFSALHLPVNFQVC
jgi:hypothetical protein